MWVQRERAHLRVGDHAACGIPSRVQLRFDAQPGRRSRMANERDHRLKGVERTTAPILGDGATSRRTVASAGPTRITGRIRMVPASGSGQTIAAAGCGVAGGTPIAKAGFRPRDARGRVWP